MYMGVFQPARFSVPQNPIMDALVKGCDPRVPCTVGVNGMGDFTVGGVNVPGQWWAWAGAGVAVLAAMKFLGGGKRS